MLLGIMTAVAMACAGVWAVSAGAFSGLSWIWILPVGFLGGMLAQLLLLFVILWIASACVRMDVPQERDDKFYRFLIDQAIRTLIPILGVRIRTEGLKKIPKQGRFLLVCNHLNDLDPGILLACFRKSQLAFISKRENERLFIIGRLMHKILCQSINRENDREALKTILKCVEIVKEDKASVGVFPEGYVSKDGLLHPLKGGVFKIAQRSRVPIVVCTLQGTQSIVKNLLRLRPSEVHLHVVEVIPAQELEGVNTVQIAQRVHDIMAQDLGPELVLAENT